MEHNVDRASVSPDVTADSRPSAGKTMNMEGWSVRRIWAHQFSESKNVENAVAVIIVLNVALMIWEVDLRGACKWRDIADEECKTPVWIAVANVLFLLIYTVELSIRFFADRLRFFFKFWNCLEFFIVCLGVVDWPLSLHAGAGFPSLMFLRLFRLFKLLRTVRLLQFFPELYELLRSFVSTAYAMLWGAILICIMLGFWSMLAVELAPSPSALGPEFRGHEIPEWCHDAFSSVSLAMLFFFQTLIAGDSWGVCTIPMIRQNPLTLVVFMGALLTIELGVTNLILAVIVESAATEREKDQRTKLKKKMLHEKQGLARWRAMVQDIDTDGSGTISLEELMAGFESHPETRACLQLLDVDEADLRDFFHLLDHDRSGDLSYGEFFHDLQKAHSQDTRMFLLNLKLQISNIAHMLADQYPEAAEAAPDNVVARKSRRLRTASKQHAGSEGKAEQDPPVLESRSDVVPKIDKHEVSDPFLRKVQEQLDQLTQDACAQAEMLVRNTTMLEALLASCNVEDPSKTNVENSKTTPRIGFKKWLSSRSRRQLGGVQGEAECPAEGQQVSSSRGGEANAGDRPLSSRSLCASQEEAEFLCEGPLVSSGSGAAKASDLPTGLAVTPGRALGSERGPPRALGQGQWDAFGSNGDREEIKA